MNNTPLEQEAVSAAEDRAALDAVLATLSPHQMQQIASAMLALGAMNGGAQQ